MQHQAQQFGFLDPSCPVVAEHVGGAGALAIPLSRADHRKVTGNRHAPAEFISVHTIGRDELLLLNPVRSIVAEHVRLARPLGRS